MSLPSILVVDDSPSLRRMIGACLRAGGFDVTEAADGEQAHALAEAAAADDAADHVAFGMLVTDQVMPGMDGLTLIRRLRASARYAAIPILMLTTEHDGSIREQARAAGASGFLPKPFDPDALMHAVAELLAPPHPSSEG
ncbi:MULTISPECIES: response regulator [unclassified Cupriavidus]|uniref:response regulator n=1 Tax=unclassified Cupriavidus TaxID=2640874 RepID=UPI001AE37025|nr:MULTISPECIES: response regulator [unclassified Cupriavidus]MBP0629631.1 response regulator [Cupriavidus sp. AcVe19-1a]MBP0638215.1 response regulator [Cupriavidus sp. AcVe19-6a]